MPAFQRLAEPKEGQRIEVGDWTTKCPPEPVIPFIEGDGTGPDITRAAMTVFNAAVEKAYGGKRRVVWFEIFAGDKAVAKYGPNQYLPEDTLKAIEHYGVSIKGPLTTPIGGGIRSLNVTLRQRLDLYACVRPVRWFEGVPAPVNHPEKMNVVIFRENTEDVYAGIEWEAGTEAARRVLSFLNTKMGTKIREESGVGIKPMSRFASQRLVRAAVRHALENGRRSVTFVHKGNIMKFTEGAFRNWAYELAEKEFAGKVVREEGLTGPAPAGKVIVKDRIADNMFQQILTRAGEYDVIATPNLNGDYLSDACAAQVGGLGMAPGANIGDAAALFEATHGTAPKYAGQDKVNPCSLILSGVMMFDFIGWKEVSARIVRGIERSIKDRVVTYDLARLIEEEEGKKVAPVKTSEFGKAVVERMG